MKRAVFLSAVGLCVVVAVSLVFNSWFPAFRRRQTQDAETLTRIGHLRMCLNFTANTAPKAFVETVGGGFTGIATDLPPAMTENFHITTNSSPMYWDVWHQPLNVSIEPIHSEQGGKVVVRVNIWSNGRNGRNEKQTGDDLFKKLDSLKVDPND